MEATHYDNEQQKNKNSKKRKSAAKTSRVVLPVVLACSLATAALMVFWDPATAAMSSALSGISSSGPGNESDESSSEDKTPSTSEKKDDSSAENKSEGENNSSDNNKSVPADAKKELIGDSLTLSQINDEGRAVNLGLAATALNGYEIQPGETISFNDVVGNTENNAQYQVATAVVGNTTTLARGGGICQVATSLYNAGLKADMEIVERHPHTLATDYVSIGLDATVAYGSMDLKLKNTSDYPMVISASAIGQTVEVQIMGQPLADGVTIDPIANVVERVDKQGRKQDGTEADAVFYVVESFRAYYKDGVPERQEHLYVDTYEVYDSSSVSIGEGGVEPSK